MQVRTADAPATRQHNGHAFSFCSDRCAERFDTEPDRFARQTAQHHDSEPKDDTDMAIDPVCGMTVDPTTAAAIRTHDGRNYFFCAPGCAETFDADADRFAAQAATKPSH